MTDRAGVVVAGGRSVRMGGHEKAVVDVAGTPLVRRVADGLTPAVEELVVNCRPDQQDAIAGALSGLDPTFALDAEPDRGPVAGIATGLEATDAEYAAVVACDLPFLDTALVEYLFERAAGADADAAVPKPDDWFEPLFSLEHVVVERSDLLAHGSLASFESVDTPADLAEAANRLE